jgi:hypothetical protein
MAVELPSDSQGGPGDRTWPNLWFTLAVPSESFDRTLAALREECLPFEIDELPALRRFKIDVVFDLRTARSRRTRRTRFLGCGRAAGAGGAVGRGQRALVRRMQGDSR